MLFHTTFYVTNRSAECGVELGSVDSNSQVQLRTTDMGFELGYEGVERFRAMSIRRFSFRCSFERGVASKRDDL